MTKTLSRIAAGVVTMSALFGQAPVKRYIISQAACILPATGKVDFCVPQEAPVGSLIQIQLPGHENGWKLTYFQPDRLRPLTMQEYADAPPRTKVFQNPLPSPGRIPSTDRIFFFNFRVSTPGTSIVTIQEIPPVVISQTGTLTFTITGK